MDLTGVPGVPFWRLVLVELRKTVDTRSSFWLVATIAILTVIIDGFVLLATLIQGTEISYTDFTQITLGVTGILLPILAIMLVTSEWGQRTAMVTFTLEPRRMRVIGAKLLVGLVLTVITVVIALVVAALCTLVCDVVNSDTTTWDLEVEFVVGYLITQSLSMLGGFAFAALLLNTPAAIVIYLVYQFALPTVLFVVSGVWSDFAEISPYLNFVEAQQPLIDLSLSGEQAAQLLVSGLIWLALPLGLGLWRILRAEVK